MIKTNRESKARQRIVETAERLFYSEGIRAVGIDRIIAEADVAKMTLYNHFSSKDDLVLAVLRYREEQFEAFLAETMGRHVKTGLSRLEAFFATLTEWFSSPGFRGCSFINAAVELANESHPASRFAAEHKRRIREKLTEIITESAGSMAASVAPAIAVLVEGAIVTALVERDVHAADVAKEAALMLISQAKKSRK